MLQPVPNIWSFNTFSWNTASPTILYGVLYIPSGGYLGSDNLYALNLGASQPAPIFASATTNTAGTAINITFNKAMNNPSGDQGQFTYSINGGASQAFSAAALDSNPDVIDLTTSGTPIAYDNVVTVNYTVGTVTSTDNGVLATFSNQPVTNALPVPPPTPPAVSGVWPVTGSTAGGTVVTITGTGFTGATNVYFGSTDIQTASFTSLSATQIVVNAPMGSAGTVNILVKTPAGTALLSRPTSLLMLQYRMQCIAMTLPGPAIIHLLPARLEQRCPRSGMFPSEVWETE